MITDMHIHEEKVKYQSRKSKYLKMLPASIEENN